jgi:hypothetical protein
LKRIGENWNWNVTSTKIICCHSTPHFGKHQRRSSCGSVRGCRAPPRPNLCMCARTHDRLHKPHVHSDAPAQIQCLLWVVHGPGHKQKFTPTIAQISVRSMIELDAPLQKLSLVIREHSTPTTRKTFAVAQTAVPAFVHPSTVSILTT